MAGFREWREHKYIRKEGNRYIYPEDLQRTNQRGRTTNERISRDRKIREAKEERDRLIREAQEQTRRHDNSLLNRIDQAGKAAGKTLTDAGNAVGDAATNTYKKGRKFITDLFTDASKTFENTVGSTVAKGVHKARKVAHDTGKYLDIAKIFEKPKHNAQNPFDRGEQEKDTETKNIENGRDKGYPSSASKRKYPKVNTRFVEKTTTETITPEKTITEDIIPENITPEKTSSGKSSTISKKMARERAYENSSRRADDYIRQQRKKGLSDSEIFKLTKEKNYYQPVANSFLNSEGHQVKGRRSEVAHRSLQEWVNQQKKKGLSMNSIRKLPEYKRRLKAANRATTWDPNENRK